MSCDAEDVDPREKKKRQTWKKKRLDPDRSSHLPAPIRGVDDREYKMQA